MPLTESIPKPLLPVAGVPILSRVLDTAVDAGAEDLVIVSGHRGRAIRDRYGDSFGGVPLTYTEQDPPNGTAAAVASARHTIDGDYAVLNGDCLYRESDLAALFANGPAMGVHRVNDPRNYGVVTLKNGSVIDIVEKPADPPTSLANAGAYVLPEESLNYLEVAKSNRDEYELTDTVREFISRGSIAAVEFEDWMDVGYPWEFLRANEEMLASVERSVDGTVHPAATLEGSVLVESGASVAAGVHIEGPVLVRSGSRIGPNAHIRGASVIGRGVTIGHAVEVKNSVVMDETAIPHLSYVGDSVIGRNVNLGAGTVVANVRHDREPVTCRVKGERVSTEREKFGTVIGHGTKTGINTSIDPGVRLGPKTRTAPGERIARDRGMDD